METSTITNPNPNPNRLQSPPSPPRSFAPKWPPIRVTSSFDSESRLLFSKISSKLFNGLAKLKLSFFNNRNGEISRPRLEFITKHFSVFCDLETKSALLDGSLDVSKYFHVKATHDVMSGCIGDPEYIHIGLSTNRLSMTCTCENNKSIVSCISLGNAVLFRYQQHKEQEREVSMVASLADPSYKVELSSTIPSLGWPRATLRCPNCEVSFQEVEKQELGKVQSINGKLKGQIMNGICTAAYNDNALDFKYKYKDGKTTFIPGISLPSNALSFALKRRFSPSQKQCFCYHFGSNEWSTAYKHTFTKDLKFKSGYNSDTRLGWVSLWVGDEHAKAKAVPMGTKIRFMLAVPPEDLRSPSISFQVKKRWDI